MSLSPRNSPPGLSSDSISTISLAVPHSSHTPQAPPSHFHQPSSLAASQGGPGGHFVGSNRNRSDRHTDASNVALSQQGEGTGFGAVPILGAALKPVSPLKKSANRWVAMSTVRKPRPTEASESPDVVDRKVRALLNQLTMEKFDSISDQIIAWANKSEKEKDGRTLIQVIRLVYERAIDEPLRSEMYARLCRKMTETISPKVQDDGIRNSEGKPIPGGQLFKKYILNRCQEDFERGCATKEVMAATAVASEASDDQVVKAANEKKSELYSDDYSAQKTRRQGLGLIKFIGELFKLQMLTERIMHECVKKLLGNAEEGEIESLCQLLKTVGQLLDVPKARSHMDVYFARMKTFCESPNVSPRTQFMLQDIVELRDRKWRARGAITAPTTISAVHEAVEKAAAETQSLQRIAMSRDSDGAKVSVALSQLGIVSKSSSIVMGPSSVFTKKDSECDSLSRSSLNPNTFSVQSQNDEQTA